MSYLPDNGVLLNVSKVECGIEVNEQSDSNVDIDSGPVDFDDNEKVYNSESEMGSFILANIETKKEKEIIEDEFVKQPTHNWTIGSEPLSEFDVQFLASMAFPTLFPDGKGDPTNNAIVSDISNNYTQSFADKLVIVKKSSPKNLSADCRSTVGRQVDRQVTDSLPTANQQVSDRLRKKKNCGEHEQLT